MNNLLSFIKGYWSEKLNGHPIIKINIISLGITFLLLIILSFLTGYNKLFNYVNIIFRTNLIFTILLLIFYYFKSSITEGANQTNDSNDKYPFRFSTILLIIIEILSFFL